MLSALAILKFDKLPIRSTEMSIILTTLDGVKFSLPNDVQNYGLDQIESICRRQNEC